MDNDNDDKEEEEEEGEEGGEKEMIREALSKSPQELFQRLTSISMDTMQPSIRTRILHQISHILESNVASSSSSDSSSEKVEGTRWDSNLNWDTFLESVSTSTGIRSIHSQKRVITVLTRLLLQRASSSPTSSSQDQEYTRDTCCKICTALCRTFTCREDRKVMDLLCHCQNLFHCADPNAVPFLYEALEKIWVQADEMGYTRGDWCVAMSLATYLTSYHKCNLTVQQSDLATSRKQMVQSMVKLLFQLGSKNQRLSLSDIALAKTFLQSLTQYEFDSFFVPTLALKMRANPEMIMDRIPIVFDSLSPSHIDVSLHLSESSESDAKLVPTLLKLLRSNKESTRPMVSHVLSTLAFLSGSQTQYRLRPTHIILQSIAEALAPKTKESTVLALNQPNQRMWAYEILVHMGRTLLLSEPHRRQDDPNPLPVLLSMSDMILSSLVSVLGKEVIGDMAANKGNLALMIWVGLTKVLVKENPSLPTSSHHGYLAAMDYIAKPMMMESIKSNTSIPNTNHGFDLRSLGRFIVFYSSQNTFGTTDLAESFLLDVMRRNEKATFTGLQYIIDSAMKKYANYRSVPPIDGIIAILVEILYVIATGGTDVTRLSPSTSKTLLSGSLSFDSDNLSFLYASSMNDAAMKDPMVGKIVQMIFSRCFQLTSSSNSLSTNWNLVHTCTDGKISAAAHSIACCLSNYTQISTVASSINLPQHGEDSYTIPESLSFIVSSLCSQPTSAGTLLTALFQYYNQVTSGYDVSSLSTNEAQDIRDSTDANQGIDDTLSFGDAFLQRISTSIRRVAVALLHYADRLSPDIIAKGLILMHVGTTKKLRARQRRALVSSVTKILTMILQLKLRSTVSTDQNEAIEDCLSNIIVDCATFHPVYNSDDKSGSYMSSFSYSRSVHEATLSLISSIGTIAGKYNTFRETCQNKDDEVNGIAWSLCLERISPSLSKRLLQSLASVETLTKEDVELFRGVRLANNSKNQLEDRIEDGVKSKHAKKSLQSKDEEWEKQVRREIEEKKSAIVENTKLVDSHLQTLEIEQKKDISQKLEKDLTRTMYAIQTMCLSDIQLGNNVLPIFSKTVSSAVVSSSPAMSISSIDSLRFETLHILTSCVYEIDDAHSFDVTCALVNSLSPVVSRWDHGITFVLSQIEANDDLSANSFIFLFPIIEAALRSKGSTLSNAIKILNRHASKAPSLRKDMANTVLELIGTYDRGQIFYDLCHSLKNIYCIDKELTYDKILSAAFSADLSPLLGNIGALGSKNCRIASMVTLTLVITELPTIVDNNALLENRLWLNCFAQEEEIKGEARNAWKIGFGETGNVELSPPSKFVTIPLIPLLSHRDESISLAASYAFVAALTYHYDTIEKTIVRILNLYIEAYPTSFDNVSSTSKQTEVKPIAMKPKVTTGLAKKAPVKSATGLSAIAALTTTKKKKSNTSVPSKVALEALSHKPIERTIDQEVLEAQLKSNCTNLTVETQKDNEERILTRKGVIRVLAAIAASSCTRNFYDSCLQLIVGFLISFGLGDSNEEVYTASCNALRDIVANCGTSDAAISWLTPLLEQVLINGKVDNLELSNSLIHSGKILDDVDTTDRRKEGIVIGIASAAVHIPDENVEKIASTIDTLIAALSTPSESVQMSVALGLSKIMKKGRTQERVGDLLSSLMKGCLYGNTLGLRRGSAYGIAAVVKGSGIATLKKFDVFKQLEEACSSDESTATTKEAGLFALELLSSHLGLLFEPYVNALLPLLLKSFSETSLVRTAAKSTMGTIMSRLSGHGVKLIMPAVLGSPENEDWRTKQARLDMLGSMSRCAPKQLASCLPSIVPKLIESCADTHPKVKVSAEEALVAISHVIRNPEISEISPILLNALKDPATGTLKALESLIETEFVHAVDSPSLSLIIPVIHRGLRDRTGTTKRIAAVIAGNMCLMIEDPKDFTPYIPVLIPDLKAVLVDPIPDCRSTAAKSIGSLTRSLGEVAFPDLRLWLIDVIKSDSGSSVEKSGCAQGLTEILCASGAKMVESVMKDEILPLRCHPKACVREGVLWVLTFLPTSLGQAFAPLIDSSFPALIMGLSDENEAVRDVAMRAGRIMIRSHGKAYIDKFLPSIESGLNDDDSRIRVASLSLLGDLLSTIANVKISRADSETQDDLRQAERAQSQIALLLGPEARKRVLSSLYLRRSDTVAAVRQNAIQVWKSVVSVTPRTLREILDSLVDQVVVALVSGHPERTQIAGRCLGDLVNKLGDTVLPELIPVLEGALSKDDTNTRLGACVGLTEVIGCASKEQLLKFLSILVKAVREALCDEDAQVRKLASSVFQKLYSGVGSKVLDEVVPSLLVSMDRDDDEKIRAILGLAAILSVRSKELLPYLVPRLTRKPITKNQSFALGRICEAAATNIHLHFSVIVPAILSELGSFFCLESNDIEKEREDSLRTCCHLICRSIEEIGVTALLQEIVSKCSHDKEFIRKECCWLIQCLIEERKDIGDSDAFIPIILRELLYRLNDDSPRVVKAANGALFAVSNNIPVERLVDYIEFMRNLIASIVSDARRRKGGVGDGEFFFPGFNIPKGLEPFLPIYQRGILYGDAYLREISASGLGEMILITSNDFVGPYAVKITGPLLRIVGDRNTSTVKVAIIRTLGLTLLKGGSALRAFVPQFQTTFVKSLSDPSRLVRLEAIKALELLMPLATRVDPLIKELVANVTGSDENTALSPESASTIAIQIASLEALAVVLKHGGSKVKIPEVVSSALNAAKIMQSHQDEDLQGSAAKVVEAALQLT